MPAGSRTVVLLEGDSDVAAVRTLAGVGGRSLERVELVSLGGVTNVRRAMLAARTDAPGAQVLGLCDAGEVRFVERALRELGLAVRDAGDLPAYGFFVCHRDLEEELIRALGPRRTVAVIERVGLGPRLAALQQQPAWADRPLEHQLHRFCGVASGRKERLAAELAGALSGREAPEPIALLLDRIAAASRG